MDALVKIVKNFVGRSSHNVRHHQNLDLKINHIQILQEKVEEINTAVEEFLFYEIGYTDNSTVFDFFQDFDPQESKDNHPKRKLSKAFLKAGHDLENKSILSQGFDNFGYLLSSSANCNDKFLCDLYHGFLKTMQTFYNDDLNQFFIQVEELNALKSAESEKNEAKKEIYNKKLNEVSQLADKIMRCERQVILPTLIKIIASNRAYLEESLNANKQFLLSLESLCGKKVSTLQNNNSPGILYPKPPSQSYKPISTNSQPISTNSQPIPTNSQPIPTNSPKKSPKAKFGSFHIESSFHAISAAKNIPREGIIEDPEVFELAVRSALCEYALTELKIDAANLDNVIDEASEPDEISFEDDKGLAMNISLLNTNNNN